MNCDDLLLAVFEMQETVDQQKTESEDEVKQQTRRLTYNDRLISDETLLSLSPETLKSALSDDEYKAFMEKYPDHFISKDVSTSESESTVEVIDSKSSSTTKTSESVSDVSLVQSESFELPEVTDEEIEQADELVEDDSEEESGIAEVQSVKKSGFEWTTTMTVTLIVAVLAILTIIGLIVTI